MHEPRTVFSFSLNTLYIDREFGPGVYQFFVSLKEKELERIESIAFDAEINEFHDWDEYYGVQYNNMDVLDKTARVTPALKEMHAVYKIDECWHYHSFPKGTEQIQLMGSFPCELQQYIYSMEIRLDGEDGG